MWNDINPISIYLGTTWELLTTGKYIQSGSTPLKISGNNAVSIVKGNLPNLKVKVESFSLTTKPHTHGVYFDTQTISGGNTPDAEHYGGGKRYLMQSESAGGENTGIASPTTETLGNGTPLNIQPEYITLKFWKRLT